MALDIIVLNAPDSVEKSVPLFMEDYDLIWEILEKSGAFPLTARVLEEYYGTGEIYLNELLPFKKEILSIQSKLVPSSYTDLINFLKELLELINTAIQLHQTIHFIGD